MFFIFFKKNLHLRSGKVPGSQEPYYRSKIDFETPSASAQGWLESATYGCTCPDWGNPCKHAGALLLRWATVPERFEKRASQAESIRKIRLLSHADAIRALVRLAESDSAIAAKIHKVISRPATVISLVEDEDGESDEGDEGDEEDEEEDEDEEDEEDRDSSGEEDE